MRPGINMLPFKKKKKLRDSLHLHNINLSLLIWYSRFYRIWWLIYCCDHISTTLTHKSSILYQRASQFVHSNFCNSLFDLNNHSLNNPSHYSFKRLISDPAFFFSYKDTPILPFLNSCAFIIYGIHLSLYTTLYSCLTVSFVNVTSYSII